MNYVEIVFFLVLITALVIDLSAVFANSIYVARIAIAHCYHWLDDAHVT